MKKYTCFVVSPIGDKDSPERQLADDLFELLIEPALEKFGFAVTRADKISSVSSITSDIIEHLQNSDLCVIDITGHNPNVMYECGRRHETGKPYIMMAREGERLPFDITTIRTFFYNLERPREILATKNALQETVERMVQDGFRNAASGDSLASVVELLRRIERKIDAAPMVQSGAPGPDAGKSATAKDLVKRLGLNDAFVYAKSQGDPDLLDALIPMLSKRWGDRDKFMTTVLASASMYGSRVGFEQLEALLPLGDEFNDDERIESLSCYITGSFALGEAERALGVMQRIYGDLSQVAPPSTLSAEQRARLLNQYQRLLYSLDQEQAAIAVGTRVLELCPAEPAYLYNQALNYSTVGDVQSSAAIVDRLMAEIVKVPGAQDPDHLKLAVKVYAKTGQLDRFRDAFQMLSRTDEYVAQVVSESDDVRALLKRVSAR